MPDLYVTGIIDEFMAAINPMQAIGVIGRVTGLAGEALTGEDVMYLNTGDEHFYKTNASSISTSAGFLAMAISSAASGAAVTGQHFGGYYPTGITETGTLYLSTTAGLLSISPPTGTGQVIRPFGYTLVSSGIMIAPDPTFLRIGDPASVSIHASNHIDGTDDIPFASLTGKGLMSSGQFEDVAKVDGILGGRIQSTGDYTISLSNSGQIIEMGNYTVTVPLSLNGTIGEFGWDIFQTGTGICIITGAAGVTINGTAQGGVVLGGQNYAASSYLSAADTYNIAGGA